MTVCIAGIARDETIIAACDMMVSTGEFVADNMALKFRTVHPDWNVMFSGNDVTRIVPLLRKTSLALSGDHKRALSEVENAFRDCFHEELIQKQTDLVLARYGLDMTTFLDTGMDRFGETTFTSMKYQLDQLSLDCSFLVFGRDQLGEAHIFTVEDPGIVCNHDLYGFWAIGSGGNRALSSLFFQEYRQSLPDWKAFYYIAEAKFMAEGGAVGSDTLVTIKYKDGRSLGSLGCVGPKKLWKAKGRPKIPRETESVIKKFLKEETFDTDADDSRQSASQKGEPEQ